MYGLIAITLMSDKLRRVKLSIALLLAVSFTVSVPVTVSAAVGDVLSATAIETGDAVDIKLEGLGTGGTYDYGLGEGNDPATGTPKIVFTVVSQGYTNGVLGTRTRTIYGTTRVRKPFSVSGDELTANETVDGSDVIVRIALSESIYDSDDVTGGTGGESGVAPTVTILSGFYTQGGTPNNSVSNMTVTNNSTLAYPKVIGNWSRAVAYEKVSSTIRLGATVFHGHAQNGQQVDCVKFTAADASGNSQTVTVTAATIDATYGDAVPVIEHVADINLADFTPSPATQGNIGTFNFVAYPWIGNGSSVMNTLIDDGMGNGGTGTGTPTNPSPYYGPLSFVCDPAGTYCPMIAVVDAANGVDTSNTITASDTSAAAAASHPFLTPFAAFNALRTYINTTYGRNNCGGATIYLRDNAGGVNSHVWLGGSPTLGTRPDCLLTVENYPGHSRDNCVIATQSGLRALGELLRVRGVKITATNASGIFDNGTATSYLNIDQCELSTTVTPTVYRVGVWHTTRCQITNFAQGWSNYGGSINSAPALVRGNTLASTATAIGGNQAYTIIGNLKTGSLAHSMGNPMTGNAPNSQNLVIAYNWMSSTNTSSFMLGGGNLSNPHGTAIVQNVLENRGNGGNCLRFSADGSATNQNNIVIFHNTFIGERCSMAYNEFGGRGWERYNWFVKNNIADDYNIKGDGFGTVSVSIPNTSRSYDVPTTTVTVTVSQAGHQYLDGDLLYITTATPAAYKTNGVTVFDVGVGGSQFFKYSFTAASDPGPITAMTVAPHPARIKNFPVVYGVNHSGNVWAETASMGASSQFMQSFTGLKCLPVATVGEPPTSPTNTLAWLKFVDRKSYNGSTTGAGGGDYHLQSDSPAVGIGRDWVLPRDLGGVARTATVSAGAYHYGTTPDTGALQTILRLIKSNILFAE